VSKEAAAKAKPAPAADAGVELFRHEIRHEARPLVVLRAVASTGAVVVEATVHPVGAGMDDEPMRRPFPFASELQATRFVDEALVAFEYLGCLILESADRA